MVYECVYLCTLSQNYDIDVCSKYALRVPHIPICVNETCMNRQYSNILDYVSSLFRDFLLYFNDVISAKGNDTMLLGCQSAIDVMNIIYVVFVVFNIQ